MKYYQDNLITLYNGDCRDMEELRDESDKARFCRAGIIEGFDLIKKLFFSLNNSRVYNSARHNNWFIPAIRHNESSLLYTGYFFQPTQFKQYRSLLSFDNKLGQQCLDAKYSLSIRNRPGPQWFTFLGRWLFRSLIPAKIMSKQVNNLWRNLFQPYFLAKDWLCCFICYSHLVSAALNSKIAITIKTSSKISFHSIFHNLIIPHHHYGCQVV